MSTWIDFYEIENSIILFHLEKERETDRTRERDKEKKGENRGVIYLFKLLQFCSALIFFCSNTHLSKLFIKMKPFRNLAIWKRISDLNMKQIFYGKQGLNYYN